MGHNLMRTLKAIIVASLFAMFAAASASAQDQAASFNAQNGNVAVESAERDRYIIVFNDNVGNPRNAAAALARQHGFAVRQTYTTALKGFAASLPARAVDALSRDRRVKYIEADQLFHANAQILPTGIRRIYADANGNIAIDGFDDLRIDVDVAVLDSGVAADPDINLFARADCTGNPFNETCDPDEGDDGNGHGTHVAGTIGAIDNGIGVVGVAPGARIWAIKVLKNNGSGWNSNIIGGVDWVTQQGTIEVANMSLGGGSSDALCEAIVNSVAAGTTYAVAAGNDDADAANSSPANCQVNPNGADNAADGILTVSALADFDGIPGGLAASTCRSDVDDTLANFSNWGSMIDIAAPGVCIESTWNDGGLNTISGTSMAAPHVAGAAALLASTGTYTPDQIHSTLTSEGDTIGWTDDESPDGVTEPLLDVGDDTVFVPVTVAGDGGGDPINESPTVTISSPLDGDAFGNGIEVTFTGSATDTEDDDATLSATIEWTSDIDGVIGTGTSVATTTLANDSDHTITASVTDSGGASDWASISITVGTPPEPPVGVTMFVADITMQMKGPNLDTIVTIRADTDENGADLNDAPAAGVVPHIQLCPAGGAVPADCFFTTTTIATDSKGKVKYKLLKPLVGTLYTMTVLDVTDNSGSFVYDGLSNFETEDSYTID